LLVLDEPSSNLDLVGENALITAVNEARDRGAIVVLVEHRARVFRCVDRVLVLDEGIPRELGATDKVMAELTRPSRNAASQEARSGGESRDAG